MKTSTIVFLAIIILLAALVIFFFDDSGDGPPYSAFSTDENGTSLLFDTLRRMNYPVRISYSPLTTNTNIDYVYVIIQPFAPSVNRARAEEILEWVQQGGRLIFLENSAPTILDSMIPYTADVMGNLRHYRVGRGEIITGNAYHVANYHLMNSPTTGEIIQANLSRWNADRIWFAEYYHGLHATETFVGGLPLIVRLLLAQMMLVAIVAVWHLGKRFGKPVPYYREVERDENEYVHALARLYMKIGGKNRK